jgi:hypothetical protein
MARHQRRGCLAERAGFDVMGEINDAPVPNDQIDNNSGAAEAGMGLRGGVGRGEPSKTRNIRGKLKHSPIVDLVNHRDCRPNP